MKSLVVKRSVVINGHKTSVSLEDAFWNDLRGNCAHATSDAVEGDHGDR
jgi:predicted DNA-binding ribbon-helix-helix protein